MAAFANSGVFTSYTISTAAIISAGNIAANVPVTSYSTIPQTAMTVGTVIPASTFESTVSQEPARQYWR